MLVSLATFRWFTEANHYRDDISAVIVYLDQLHAHVQSSAELSKEQPIMPSVQYRGRDMDPAGKETFPETIQSLCTR